MSRLGGVGVGGGKVGEKEKRTEKELELKGGFRREGS